MSKYLAILIILVCYTCTCVNAEAGNFNILPAKPTDLEMNFLPSYCEVKFKYGMNRKNPLVRKWLNILGDDFVHVHHH